MTAVGGMLLLQGRSACDQGVPEGFNCRNEASFVIDIMPAVYAAVMLY